MWCFSYAFRQIYNLCILLSLIFKYTSIGAFIIIFYAIFAISRFFYNHQIIHYSVFFSFAVSIERYIEKLHNERMRIDVDVTTILSQISVTKPHFNYLYHTFKYSWSFDSDSGEPHQQKRNLSSSVCETFWNLSKAGDWRLICTAYCYFIDNISTYEYILQFFSIYFQFYFLLIPFNFIVLLQQITFA